MRRDQTAEELRATNTRLRREIERLSEHSVQNQRFDVETLATVLRALPDLIFILSAEGRYMEVFTGEHNLLAAPTKELLGRTVHDALPAQVARELQAVIDRTLADQDTQTIDYDLDVPEGTRWFNATIVPIVYASQACVLWVARDVTERKLAEQETRRARDAAIESNRLKSQFLANTSHELRTPLNGVIGFADMLRDTALSGSQQEYVNDLTSCANTLLDIINDVLDFSKLDANRVALSAEPFDLRGTVRQVVTWFSLNNRDRPLRFTCEIDDAIAPLLVGDQGRIRQILMNLVGNAAKFTLEGAIDVRVNLASEAIDRVYIGFEVADTGIGIPPESLRSIFEPFVQTDGSASRQFGGTGLGLSIVRSLVTLLDGEIDVESTPDVGTTFAFTIPLRGVQESDAQTTPGESDPAQPDEAVMAGPSRHVLIVEDNPLGQKVARRIVEKLGHRVTIASDGQSAIDRLADEVFDLVLMDCQMPLVDGYEATRRIRATCSPARDIPIIALTADVSEGNRQACFDVGMNDYLTKPIVREDLRSAILKWTDSPSTARDTTGVPD